MATDTYAESLRLAAEKGHELNEAQLGMVASIGELDRKVEQSTAASDLTSQWNTAMGTLAADTSKALTGIFTGEGNPLGKLGDAFKEFGKTALSSIITLFVTPFQNAITGLFEGLAERVTGFFSNLLGGGGGGGGGLLGGLGGGGGGGGGGGSGGGGPLGGILGSNPVGALIGAGGAIVGGLLAGRASKGTEISFNTRLLLGWTKDFFPVFNASNDRIEGALLRIEDRNKLYFPVFNTSNDLMAGRLGNLLTLTGQMLNELRGVRSNTAELQPNLITWTSRMVTELKGIRSNTSELQGIVSAIRESASSQSTSLSSVSGRGPEMFVPSRSGRIEPNGSSGGAVDAKALARAVADALEGTRMDVDGRQFGRLVVRNQPLAAAELGGRR